ncbi:MAG: hypothetical protein HFE44_12195 [Oscillospiraceae bacterium]|jgi:hypothetical protein|nr:hypothetical protein [Oscillospiraceae bacterium]
MSKDTKKGRKSRKLFRAIGDIDERMILGADKPQQKRKNRRRATGGFTE